MTRKRSHTQPISAAPVIPPISDAPGPDDGADVLRTHYRLVQEALAIHAYDDLLYVCKWCLADAPLTHAKIDTRGTRMYCSERCAKAYAAYQKSRTEIKGAAIPAEEEETQ